MIPGRLLLSLLAVLIWVSGPAHSSEEVDTEQAQLTSLHDYFFAAARSGEVSVLKEFIKAGFPIDDRNGQSYTALMIAAYQGQSEAVKFLLEGGAAPCLRDKRGHTALMGAVIKGEWQIARTLYAIDCDWDNDSQADDPVTDKSTMTAAQFAEYFGQGDRFRVLATGTAESDFIESEQPSTQIEQGEKR